MPERKGESKQVNKAKTFDWAAASTTAREGMQGQRFTTVLSSENAPGTPDCKVLITMGEGKVSNVHVHLLTHVYVDVIECGPQGVLTLAGEKLEQEVWTLRRQTLWIPPGVPHVAVYPRNPVGSAPDVFAVETRTSSSAVADVVPLDDMGDLLVARLHQLGLSGLITPSAQMSGYRRGESSCFPPSL
jgi:uncharacterized RmlC-like cupin family protein